MDYSDLILALQVEAREMYLRALEERVNDKKGGSYGSCFKRFRRKAVVWVWRGS